MNLIPITPCNYNYNGITFHVSSQDYGMLINPRYIIYAEFVDVIGNNVRLDTDITKIELSEGLRTKTIYCYESLEEIQKLIKEANE